MTLPIARITDLLNEVVAEEVLPRFGRLAPHDVAHKVTAGDADDVVSVVDHAVEARLTRGLEGLVPGTAVIGEEAVQATPGALRAASAVDAVFWIDPIDGTKAFVRGGDAFGVMIAFVRGGVTQAAWIALPARGEVFVAERGAGAFRNGARVRVPEASRSSAALRGSVYDGFLPADLKARADAFPAALYARVPASGCAAVEYTGLACGAKDFVTYHRLLPWDHAAGVLVLGEAGGAALRRDGRAYTTDARHELLVAGARPTTATTVLGWFTS